MDRDKGIEMTRLLQSLSRVSEFVHRHGFVLVMLALIGIAVAIWAFVPAA